MAGAPARSRSPGADHGAAHSPHPGLGTSHLGQSRLVAGDAAVGDRWAAVFRGVNDVSADSALVLTHGSSACRRPVFPLWREQPRQRAWAAVLSGLDRAFPRAPRAGAVLAGGLSGLRRSGRALPIGGRLGAFVVHHGTARKTNCGAGPRDRGGGKADHLAPATEVDPARCRPLYLDAGGDVLLQHRDPANPSSVGDTPGAVSVLLCNRFRSSTTGFALLAQSPFSLLCLTCAGYGPPRWRRPVPGSRDPSFRRLLSGGTPLPW